MAHRCSVTEEKRSGRNIFKEECFCSSRFLNAIPFTYIFTIMSQSRNTVPKEIFQITLFNIIDRLLNDLCAQAHCYMALLHMVGTNCGLRQVFTIYITYRPFLFNRFRYCPSCPLAEVYGLLDRISLLKKMLYLFNKKRNKCNKIRDWGLSTLHMMDTIKAVTLN